jgi:methionyl-tRNA synthetase
MIRNLDFAHPAIIIVIVILGLWEAVWKAIALWHAGRNRHLAWFVVLFILNTAGILEIIYIFAVGRPALKRVEPVETSPTS